MDSTVATAQEWAESLVGRDWEIYWNDDQDNDEKETAAGAAATSLTVEASSGFTDGKTDDQSENGSHGSVIDDWYAGRVLSATVQESGTVLVTVLFVGDEQLYEMDLGPTKVRASARGWIKRTMAILSRRGNLPPDTATPEDRRHLQALQDTRQFDAISVPQPKDGIAIPTVSELKDIMELRKCVMGQVYLRSKLATIVNLHGSIKSVDGEPNPTETLVNHLNQFCKDLAQACDWYLKCWELLTTCFCQRSGQSSNGNESRHERSIDYDSIFDDYMEFGKNCILNCATVDLESTTSKRRTLVTPINHRRPKRRRKNKHKWAKSEQMGLEAFSEEGDFRCMTFVDQFVQKINQPSQSWYLPLLTNMFHTLSHYIVDPLVHWKHRVNLILGRSDDLNEALDIEGGPMPRTTSLLKELPFDRQSSTSLNELMDDNASIDSSESEQGRTFTYDDVQACLIALKENPVVSLLNTSEEESALQSKLRVIETIGKQAKSLMERLAEDTVATSDTTTSDPDEVLAGLQGILKALNAPEHGAFNINPVGKPGTLVTREMIQVAVLWRSWMLDVRHASLVRERKVFLETVVRQMEDLPDLQDIPAALNFNLSQRAHVVEQVREIQATLASLAETEQRYCEILNKNEATWFCKERVRKALRELEALPVLLPEEEKLMLRLRLLEWSEEAATSLPQDTSISFPQLEKLYDSLQQILEGKVGDPTKMITKVKAHEKVESMIRRFVAQDIRWIDSDRCDRVTALYASASQWKERAEGIILALRTHGNVAVGGARPSIKVSSLVDIKRISDLLSEYKALGVEVVGYTSCLQRVLNDAFEWSRRIEDNLLRQSLPMKDCLVILERESQMRPKGLITDPTRHIMDTLHDLLEWHERSKATLDKVITALELAEGGSSLKQEFSDLILFDVYPLLAEGSALVEMFSHENQSKYQASASVSGQILEESFGIRRSTRALLRERLEAHPLGSNLLHRIVNKEIDTREGSPLTMLLWYDWHLTVDDFILSVDSLPVGGKVQTLSEARDILSKQPRMDILGDPFDVLYGCTSNTTERLKQLMEGAEALENSIHELLLKSRDLRKGCLGKADSVRLHLTELKAFHSLFRDRASGEKCLVLDALLEPQLEQHIKVFTWLVRTFAYPFLYLDEASYSDAHFNGDDVEARVPWDVLVTLFERLPVEDEVQIDDFALASLRIRELYQAARKWQDEITRFTLLSNRGGKRRGLGVTPAKGEQDVESSKLQLAQMEQLAADPILAKIAMPREGAVNRILQNSKEFEIQLHLFLGKDFDGSNPDRAAYPGSHSLVGKKGEFILYRLTGSELFESMQKAMSELSAVADNVFAETPGKITFDWINRAVLWIEELNESVSKDSPFHSASENILVVPHQTARKLVKSGAEIFLDLPDDSKRTLSQHGILVSTNKQEQILRVSLKKDGAHHSVGGTVIRWCSILFECLKADVTRLDNWQRELKTIHEEFKDFFAGTQNNPKDREEDLYQWYCFRQRAIALLDDGARSLVVAPTQGLVSICRNFVASLENRITKHNKAELDQKFAKMCFMEGASLLDDRFVLLESLLYRKSLVTFLYPAQTLGDVDGRSFRDICRSSLVTSFARAATTIGLTNFRKIFSPGVLESFCFTKAWEIENEMFDRFQDDLGVTRVSDEYRTKARYLRVSLDDKNNLSLCLRVFVGDISATSIVNMTTVQLASQKATLDRARGNKEVVYSTNVTPEIDAEPNENAPLHEEPNDEESKEGNSSKGTSPSKLTSILRNVIPSSTLQLPDELLPPMGRVGTVNASVATETGGNKFDGKGESHVAARHLTTSSVFKISVAAKKFVGSKSPPPPPPPSLATAFKQTPDETSDEKGWNGQPVLNESGGHRFRFDIGNLRVGFTAALHLEDQSVVGIDRFLPASLAEKGRVPEKEFTKFMKDKAKGGRWMATALRLDPVSDSDDREYKRLCRVYEEKERIVIISVSSDTKVFLVTPKFHTIANQSGIEPFSSRTSAYAVVLTRDARLFRKLD